MSIVFTFRIFTLEIGVKFNTSHYLIKPSCVDYSEEKKSSIHGYWEVTDLCFVSYHIKEVS